MATDVTTEKNKIIDYYYSALLNKMQNGKLIPGQRYRITDFVSGLNAPAAVGQDKVEYRSFDLILTAKTTNSFYREVTATLPKNRTNRAKYVNLLEKFIIHYDITFKGDSESFTNEFGIITYMKDPFGNEAPYDFINKMYYFGNEIDETKGRFAFYDENNVNYFYTYGYPIDSSTTETQVISYGRIFRNNTMDITSYFANNIISFKNVKDNDIKQFVIDGNTLKDGTVVKNIILSGSDDHQIVIKDNLLDNATIDGKMITDNGVYNRIADGRILVMDNDIVRDFTIITNDDMKIKNTTFAKAIKGTDTVYANDITSNNNHPFGTDAETKLITDTHGGKDTIDIGFYEDCTYYVLRLNDNVSDND